MYYYYVMLVDNKYTLFSKNKIKISTKQKGTQLKIKCVIIILNFQISSYKLMINE